MYMIFFVLDDPNRLNELLDAWEHAGIRGVTILDSTGLHRVRRKFIPMRYALSITNQEESHTTLLAIVDNTEKIQACLQNTEALIGDLDQPHTGVFAAWPLSIVKGFPEEAAG